MHASILEDTILSAILKIIFSYLISKNSKQGFGLYFLNNCFQSVSAMDCEVHANNKKRHSKR
ncbi:hypothetical protein BpHYR1_027324 [Brachionus plicatilis]|uniref:Uncharacterized protein n=1 Tax=Brachionus plicatilis TaxID=10195 RepID=A0A3M7T5M8_BRAPC|nr:hypothetical protein BpHYR1_027324 [Brachionus plicatilis]